MNLYSQWKKSAPSSSLSAPCPSRSVIKANPDLSVSCPALLSGSPWSQQNRQPAWGGEGEPPYLACPNYTTALLEGFKIHGTSTCAHFAQAKVTQKHCKEDKNHDAKWEGALMLQTHTKPEVWAFPFNGARAEPVLWNQSQPVEHPARLLEARDPELLNSELSQNNALKFRQDLPKPWPTQSCSWEGACAQCWLWWLCLQSLHIILTQFASCCRKWQLPVLTLHSIFILV